MAAQPRSTRMRNTNWSSTLATTRALIRSTLQAPPRGRPWEGDGMPHPTSCRACHLGSAVLEACRVRGGEGRR
jgi:hypothetical protein